MRYLPHTGKDVQTMLEAVGVASVEDLFGTIPPECRTKGTMALPERLNEWELNDWMDALAASVATEPEYKIFLGAGSYEHHIPATIPYLLGRSEFATAYTPYQPEISQGTLQAIFEYQTLTARLLGTEVANASLYDGASALAEALLMALRIKRRKRVAVSSLIHPFYRQVVQTYLGPTDYEMVALPCTAEGRTDLSSLEGMEDLAAVAVQSPNFLGCIEPLDRVAESVHGAGALFVCCFSEALAYGLLKSPGEQGADIVCGEGQSLGVPRSFGGPALGMLGCRKEYVRSMPGRLVGETRDAEGRRGFVLTLATREQHIRREKATSNICTNNSLCAVAAAMYMASVGGAGLKELAVLNHDKAEYLKGEMQKAGFKLPFAAPTFNEFVVEAPGGFEKICARLLKKKIVPGISLKPFYAEWANCYLMCVTETKSRNDMDLLVREVSA